VVSCRGSLLGDLLRVPRPLSDTRGGFMGVSLHLQEGHMSGHAS
jgi:hypothetical protein